MSKTKVIVAASLVFICMALGIFHGNQQIQKTQLENSVFTMGERADRLYTSVTELEKLVMSLHRSPNYEAMVNTTVTINVEFSPCGMPGCSGACTMGHGSGVLVGQGTVLTAKHVMAHHDRIVNRTVVWRGVEYQISSVLNDPDSDLSVVYVAGMPEHPIAEVSMEDPPLGAQVITIGTPSFRELAGTLVKGYVENLHEDHVWDSPTLKANTPDQFLRDWSRLVSISALTDNGHSGGPVFYNGKVVGLFVGSIVSRSGFKHAVYVPIYELDTPL